MERGQELNEWGFAGEVKSRWDRDLARNPGWAADRWEVESQEEGSLKRSDLALKAAGRTLVVGELRLPDHPESSPWDPENLNNAISKALTAGAGWAFTSDACELLLIDVSKTGPAQARVVDSFTLANFKNRRDLESAAFLEDVLGAFSDAHQRFMPIVLGAARPAGLALDEVFVNSLRALLFKPVAAIRQALDARRLSDPLFEQALVRWMVDEQGWPHDVSNWEAEVDRTAHLTAYVFTTRLMFYESLRRTHTMLSPLTLPDVNASVAKSLLAGYFADAREKSGDYETIFAWDQVAQYALLSDATVPGWTRVLEHLAGYELSSIGHDVIGRMFERLIRPEERSRWGQFYTSAHVADLMLSFGLPDGTGSFLDPASGGGTLLVRGYARKRHFDPNASHQDLLKEIFGADISAFAATLSTVNLAARDPQFSDNYPRVAATSFFKLSPGGPFVRLPNVQSVPLNGGPQGDGSGATIEAKDVDAVVSNPPYVRVQELAADTKVEAASVLGRVTGRAPTPRRVHGLSNYHVYFWLHAGQFLRPGGRLVFITSGEWLDSDYGAVLQRWLLDNFKIVAFVESLAEPWFSEARVGTVVTVAELCPDEDERAQNLVRFVMLRKPLQQLYGAASDEADHMERVDALRHRILSLPLGTKEMEDLDYTVIQQGELALLGESADAVPTEGDTDAEGAE